MSGIETGMHAKSINCTVVKVSGRPRYPGGNMCNTDLCVGGFEGGRVATLNEGDVVLVEIRGACLEAHESQQVAEENQGSRYFSHLVLSVLLVRDL